MDAALATDGLDSITISGTWRPYDTGAHGRGLGLDIGAVNGENINNEKNNTQQPYVVQQFSYNHQGASRVIQPWMIFAPGFQVSPPLRPDMGNGFVGNARYAGVKEDWGHLNHLHIGYN
jgi:hypothetical protein